MLNTVMKKPESTYTSKEGDTTGIILAYLPVKVIEKLEELKDIIKEQVDLKITLVCLIIAISP